MIPSIPDAVYDFVNETWTRRDVEELYRLKYRRLKAKVGADVADDDLKGLAIEVARLNIIRNDRFPSTAERKEAKSNLPHEMRHEHPGAVYFQLVCARCGFSEATRRVDARAFCPETSCQRKLNYDPFEPDIAAPLGH